MLVRIDADVFPVANGLRVDYAMDLGGAPTARVNVVVRGPRFVIEIFSYSLLFLYKDILIQVGSGSVFLARVRLFLGSGSVDNGGGDVFSSAQVARPGSATQKRLGIKAIDTS